MNELKSFGPSMGFENGGPIYMTCTNKKIIIIKHLRVINKKLIILEISCHVTYRIAILPS